MAQIQITNQSKFDRNVCNVDTDDLRETLPCIFTGTLMIQTWDHGTKSISGEHGANDYEDQFGFEII